MIVGLDEVGRGALAGPVTAACVYIPPTVIVPEGLTDSKKLTPKLREMYALWIHAQCIVGIASVSNSYIDTRGILKATQRAMRRSLSLVAEKIPVTAALVDGRDAFTFCVPHTSIIKGDELEYCIAAASIVAKVHRDAFMRNKDKRNRYNFYNNKGYGTHKHLEGLKKHGLTTLHRRTFIHI